jgi:transaldolase
MDLAVAPGSQLAQLAGMTTLSIDTGDLDVIAEFAATGLITDATTNPLFVSQAGLSGDARYKAFVDAAIAYARTHATSGEGVLELAMDRLAVELGLEIVKLVPGYVSTEVDIRASFDTAESLRRARRIIDMYEAAGVPRSRVLVKLAGTWEGIQAARVLEKEGIRCNITLIFGCIQAIAAAQAGARLISPFPGRIKDWHAANGGAETYEPAEDPGVKSVAQMYRYYKKHGHDDTICMPASWRPSRGPSDAAYAVDEIVALAGVDRMTVPPALLRQLAETEAPLPRILEASEAAAACTDIVVGGGDISEAEYRLAFNQDVCATTKMAEGINAFVSETLKLEAALRAKLE